MGVSTGKINPMRDIFQLRGQQGEEPRRRKSWCSPRSRLAVEELHVDRVSAEQVKGDMFGHVETVDFLVIKTEPNIDRRSSDLLLHIQAGNTTKITRHRI